MCVRYFRFQVKNYIRVLRSNLEAQILIMFPWRSVRCHERKFIVSEKEKLDKRNSSNDLTKVILFYKQFSQ